MAEIHLSKAAPSDLEQPGEYAVKKLVEEYLHQSRQDGMRKATLKWLSSYFSQHLLPYIGPEADIRTVANQRYAMRYRDWLLEKANKEEAEIKPRSVKTFLTGFKMFLSWCKIQGYIEQVPTFPRLRGIEAPGPKETFTEEEVWLLLEACNQEASYLLKLRARAMILLMVDSGMRVSEVAQARYDRIKHHVVVAGSGDPGSSQGSQQEEHVLHIVGAKGGRPRKVPMSARVWSAVSEYRKVLTQEPHGKCYARRITDPVWLFTSNQNLEEPLTESGIRRMCVRLERYLEGKHQPGQRLDERGRAEGLRINPHKFRRFFARSVLKAGHGRGSLAESEIYAMEVGGWSDRRTLRRYYAEYEDERLAAEHHLHSPVDRLGAKAAHWDEDGLPKVERPTKPGPGSKPRATRKEDSSSEGR